MTLRVPVEIPARAARCEVLVGGGALGKLPELLNGPFSDFRPVVVADIGALRFHGGRLRDALPPETPILEVPSGEHHKNRARKQRIEDRLLSRRLGRDTVIVGFGGGVLTDLAGYVAATYLRGVPFIALPTTLLAAVDASIGGKTGVNTRHGKNLIGVIRQPAAVVADTSLLRTLPDTELQEGLAEALKMAATSDALLFSELERDLEPVLRRVPEALARLIERSVRTKAGVVAADEREAGLREVLNFGHTVGHGLEHASGFRLPHGRAVAIGVLAESRMAVRAGFLPPPRGKAGAGPVRCRRASRPRPAEAAAGAGPGGASSRQEGPGRDIPFRHPRRGRSGSKRRARWPGRLGVSPLRGGRVRRFGGDRALTPEVR